MSALINIAICKKKIFNAVIKTDQPCKRLNINRNEKNTILVLH